MNPYAVLDPALEVVAQHGSDLSNGLTSHAPMTAEALCAAGRPDAVAPWLERYRRHMTPRPASRERIAADAWQAALGRAEREADWNAFFADALAEAPWRVVVARWAARLAPGACANATHGVIRVGHALRALADAETPARMHELGAALASWAANYQTLPTARTPQPATRVAAALARVRIVPVAEREFKGTIVASLEDLEKFPAFAPTIGLLDVARDPSATISDLTETFARVYLANARDTLSTIVFVHGVTSAAALRSVLPHLPGDGTREAVAYAWQAASALYAAFATAPPAAGEIEPPHESPETLIDMAIANGDEHAIKLTEACLREHAIRPSAAYLAAAHHATTTLPKST
jgi:hypothetical protein